MKLAVMLGEFSIGNRPLDFDHIFDSPRGLTGTDLSFVRTIQELKRLGHDVYGFTKFVGDTREWQGIKMLPASEARLAVDASFDAAVSMNEPNLLIGVPASVHRVVWQFLNDFSFVQAGFDDSIDHYFGVCEQHTRHVAAQCTRPEKWSTLGLGCDPELYRDSRVPGRVTYCSSPDRGLHWLLQCWPDIKANVPGAHLRIFYHWSHDALCEVTRESVAPQGGPYHPHIIELGQRCRYIKDAIPKLKHLGVEWVGSVSRERMAQEMSEASVLAYPCDTVAFSEGFSVSILEAHASYTMPVITDADCLGSIYKDSGCEMVASPARDHLAEFTEKVVKQLKLEEWGSWSRGDVERCRAFAEERTWAKQIGKLDAYLREHA
jgi:glycosyltransferase involved in cell wall biosynthesis